MRRKVLDVLLALVLVLVFSLIMVLPTVPALAANVYLLTVERNGGGTVTNPGLGNFVYDEGSVVSLIAQADNGFRFVYWTGDVGTVGDVNASATTITMNSDYSVTAFFAANTYVITASADTRGSISPPGAVAVNYNDNQTFTITPDTGYHIVDVLVDGSSVGAVDSYTFNNVIANHNILASFAINTYDITPKTGANGAISISGNVTVNYGGTQTFTIVPNTGYHIASVLVDGSSVGAVPSYTFSNVTAKHTLAANFAVNTYTVTTTAGANGSISPSGTATVNHGGSQTFTIAPQTGYHIVDVLVDGSSVGAVPVYTFSNVTAKHTLAASFAASTYTIRTTAMANGAISPSGNVTVNYGDTQVFTITPDLAFRIANVLVDGSPVGTASDYTFSNVTSDHTVMAIFTFGWPLYAGAGIVVVIIFLIGLLVGRKTGVY